MTLDEVNSVMGKKLVVLKEEEKRKEKRCEKIEFNQHGEPAELKKMLKLIWHNKEKEGLGPGQTECLS